MQEPGIFVKYRGRGVCMIANSNATIIYQILWTTDGRMVTQLFNRPQTVFSPATCATEDIDTGSDRYAMKQS